MYMKSDADVQLGPEDRKRLGKDTMVGHGRKERCLVP